MERRSPRFAQESTSVTSWEWEWERRGWLGRRSPWVARKPARNAWEWWATNVCSFRGEVAQVAQPTQQRHRAEARAVQAVVKDAAYVLLEYGEYGRARPGGPRFVFISD